MSDISRLSPGSERPAAGRSSLGGYRTAEAAAMRAATFRSHDDGATQRALERLGKFLDAGTAPRRDVPRGYYLNVVI